MHDGRAEECPHGGAGVLLEHVRADRGGDEHQSHEGRAGGADEQEKVVPAMDEI